MVAFRDKFLGVIWDQQGWSLSGGWPLFGGVCFRRFQCISFPIILQFYYVYYTGSNEAIIVKTFSHKNNAGMHAPRINKINLEPQQDYYIVPLLAIYMGFKPIQSGFLD